MRTKILLLSLLLLSVNTFGASIMKIQGAPSQWQIQFYGPEYGLHTEALADHSENRLDYFCTAHADEDGKRHHIHKINRRKRKVNSFRAIKLLICIPVISLLVMLNFSFYRHLRMQLPVINRIELILYRHPFTTATYLVSSK